MPKEILWNVKDVFGDCYRCVLVYDGPVPVEASIVCDGYNAAILCWNGHDNAIGFPL